METPDLVTVECPTCRDLVNIIVGSSKAAGTVERRECSDGHIFWVRFGADPRVWVVPAPSASGS